MSIPDPLCLDLEGTFHYRHYVVGGASLSRHLSTPHSPGCKLPDAPLAFGFRGPFQSESGKTKKIKLIVQNEC